ncbi:hypothetical protein LOD99_6833 [Oopsacas minuta]|uniref:CUE domain-containing protein n=1 Tax=Oopsacas minuta TaxID=111878 RepID=A0AAV7JJH5_9METZ|nr:hypothetical protein LOD99_6833 [Oopsacas minuta]
MNPLLSNKHQNNEQQPQRSTAAQKKTNAHRVVNKAQQQNKQRRPPPPARERFMTSPPTSSEIRVEYAQPMGIDDRLTHLSQLFPDIDSPVIMDILRQKRGNIEAATHDLFQLTNPSSMDTVSPPTVPGVDSFELPPCYDDLDAYYFPAEKSVDINASLPVFTKNQTQEKPRLGQHPELKRFNTSVGILRPEAPISPPKDYLTKWKKGETNRLNVNGKTVLIGPLPNDFLRVRISAPVRAKSFPDTPIAQFSTGPNDEISRTREGRISPFRLPLKLEELDVPIDPDETENQVFEDYKIAHYLQNVEFLQRVKQNQQLYSEVRQAANMDSSQFHSQGTLKRMDKATKKKLTKLAKKLPKNTFQQYT